MRFKRPYIARADQVAISREGEYASIDYREPGVSSVRLKIGAGIDCLTDAEILELHNDVLRAQQELAAAYVHVAKEVPPGRPQVSFEPRSGVWVPRGDVLRCVIEDEGGGVPTVYVDDVELSWEDFGRTLLTWAGWGVRLVMVPEDELTRTPRIEVREPDETPGA